jgi:hypothetical protein
MNRPAAAGFARARLDGAGPLAAVLVAFMAVLVPSAAQAHEGAPTSFASITIAGTRVLYSLTTSGQPLTQIGPAGEARLGSQGATQADPARMATLIAQHLRIEADGRRCLPGATDFVPPSPPRLSTTYNIEFRCDAPIGKFRVTDDSFDVLGRGAHTLLRLSVQGREEPLASAILLADEMRSAGFEIGPPDGGSAASEPGHRAPGTETAGGSPRAAIGFLPLGIRHILEGWDHLLFLLVLVLPGGSPGNLVRIVTAFTVAHSLTLAAAALELISVAAAPVEALIALSVAWVAAENLARVRPMSRRWAVAFAFGLIHGLGFSTVLRDIGLPRDALLASLMWFNLGIELGQLLVVLMLVPALVWLGRLRPGKLVPHVLSGLVFVASVVLLVQRF